MLQDQGYRAITSHGMFVYASAFTVANYTAHWQGHNSVNKLPTVITQLQCHQKLNMWPFDCKFDATIPPHLYLMIPDVPMTTKNRLFQLSSSGASFRLAARNLSLTQENDIYIRKPKDIKHTENSHRPRSGLADALRFRSRPRCRPRGRDLGSKTLDCSVQISPRVVNYCM